MPEKRVGARQRLAIAERAGGRCEYCQSPSDFSSDPFSTEHILPRVAGGTHHPSNLAYSCLGCNNFKDTATQAVDPTTGEEAPLYHPRRDRWHDHFAWSDDFTEIVGVTATGRATVERLQLNRQGVVNLRRVLVAVGKHPPSRSSEER
jgi:hypothetical protein